MTGSKLKRYNIRKTTENLVTFDDAEAFSGVGLFIKVGEKSKSAEKGCFVFVNGASFVVTASAHQDTDPLKVGKLIIAPTGVYSIIPQKPILQGSRVLMQPFGNIRNIKIKEAIMTALR